MREDTVNVTMRVNEKLLKNLLAIDSVEKLIALQDEEVNGYIQVSGYAHCSTGMFNVIACDDDAEGKTLFVENWDNDGEVILFLEMICTEGIEKVSSALSESDPDTFVEISIETKDEEEIKLNVGYMEVIAGIGNNTEVIR